MSVVESLQRQSDEIRVARWRLAELLRAGYTWDQGVLLASRPEIDLRRAVELLLKGCPADTAVRILL